MADGKIGTEEKLNECITYINTYNSIYGEPLVGDVLFTSNNFDKYDYAMGYTIGYNTVKSQNTLSLFSIDN